jgi:hypothetical protein
MLFDDFRTPFDRLWWLKDLNHELVRARKLCDYLPFFPGKPPSSIKQ